METRLRIEGMHCGACVAKVEAALRGVAGVESASVSLEERSARVVTAGEPSRRALEAAVAGAGAYSAHLDGAAGTRVQAHSAPAAAEEAEESLYPLFLIVGYLILAVGVIAWATGDYRLEPMMRHFMAGFFLVFSFFKLLDLRGFADAYRGYDLVARAVPAWAFAYPFVELALGVVYLAGRATAPVHAATMVLMLVGAAGVAKALLAKRAIRCACLGSVLNLPMTKVTLVEDVGMAVMAGGMWALG